MKYLLIYFTGTYNTRYLTDQLEKRLVGAGHEVTRVEISRYTEPVDTNGYDFIGFSYPIYGFNTPIPFDRYIKTLKFNKGQKYFIYKNSGEVLAMNNASSRIFIRRFKRKGMELVGEYHFVMPYNIHFPFDKVFVREILEYDDKLLDMMVYNLDNGIVKLINSKNLYNFAAFFVAINKIAGNVNSFLYKVDKDKCIKCNKCVKDCPEKNIYINKKGKIKFHHRCDMCMRCSFFCPTEAIHIGFLQSWLVTGDYKLKEIAKQPYDKKYITDGSEGFYKCYINYFKKIDADYEEYLKKIKQPAQEVAVTELEESEK